MTIPRLHDGGDSTGRTGVLPLLFEMGRTITECKDLRQTMEVLLKIMKDHMGVVRGMLTLYHRTTGKIFVHKSLGLTGEEEARGIYDLGEGITGKVVESGKPIVVPKIRDDPNFLGRTHTRDEEGLDYSFLCIPILRGRNVLGTISIEKPYTDSRGLGEDVEFLTFITAIIAQAVELYLLENEEKVFWENENRRLQEALKEKFHPSNIIGNSPPMREVYSLIEKIAKTRVTALILGESGVGKELVANALHYNSACAEGPFIKFNCAALPESIIESELFGHEKGSFTGADSLRKGRFEEADGGSILLDEVGELSPAMQAKLLRVLQERTFERVGGNKPIGVNIRIIAATNRDLMKMVADGRFREDLYYRLSVFTIKVPPLRERREEIPYLIEQIFRRTPAGMRNGFGSNIPSRLIDAALLYEWRGNLRELHNFVTRTIVMRDPDAAAQELEAKVAASVATAPQDRSVGLPPPCAGIRSAVRDVKERTEVQMIQNALEVFGWNRRRAAQYLNISYRGLLYKIQQHSLRPRQAGDARQPAQSAAPARQNAV